MSTRRAGWSRRDVLARVAGTGVAMVLKPSTMWAVHEIQPTVADIVRTTIDTRNHIDVALSAADRPGPALDLAGEMTRSGLSAICMTFAVDYQRLSEPSQGYDRFVNGLTSMDEQLARNGMKRSLNLADVRAAHAAGKPTVIQSVEGAHFLEGRVARVEEAYGRGLRHVGLLHDSDASVPLGDVYTNPATLGGLTALGTNVVRECNRLGILVDLAHGSVDTVRAALKVTKTPVIISHTGLDTQLGQNPNMARMMRPRLISKELAQEVAGAGGVVCVWTHLADTPAEYVQNIRALIDVMGIDHVGIGTDTKLTPASGGGRGSGRGPQGNAEVQQDVNARGRVRGWLRGRTRTGWPGRRPWWEANWRAYEPGVAGPGVRLLLRRRRCDVEGWLQPGRDQQGRRRKLPPRIRLGHGLEALRALRCGRPTQQLPRGLRTISCLSVCVRASGNLRCVRTVSDTP
jgi:membrane dipeptidase